MVLAEIEGHTIVEGCLTKDSIVLDLGANLGRFSHAIVDRYHCRCHALEANPELCRAIRPTGGLSVHHCAIASESGICRLKLNTNCESSTILDISRPGDTGHIDVRAVRLEEFARQQNLVKYIDLIKIDIEGAEIQVLESTSDAFFKRVGQISIEFHDFNGITPKPIVEHAVRRMQNVGFQCLKMWRTGYGDTLFVNSEIVPVTDAEYWWARHVTRNWRGMKKRFARALSRSRH
jgi:FkbM family methyltransferase